MARKNRKVNSETIIESEAADVIEVKETFEVKPEKSDVVEEVQIQDVPEITEEPEVPAEPETPTQPETPAEPTKDERILGTEEMFRELLARFNGNHFIISNLTSTHADYVKKAVTDFSYLEDYITFRVNLYKEWYRIIEEPRLKSVSQNKV